MKKIRQWLAAAALAGMSVAAAAQPAPIKFGFAMSQTGPLAANGKALLIAMQMWAEDQNAKGGLLGRKVELVYYDDQSLASNVPGLYSKLLDIDKVDVVLSGYGTNMTAPAMPVVMQHDKVFMTIFVTGINEKFQYERFFSITPNGPNSRTELSKGYFDVAMTMNPRPTTVALVGADAEFSQVALDGAREHVKRLGLKVVYDKSYPPSTTDYAPVLRAIQATNPDFIFVASYPADSSGLLRAANEIKLKTRMFGGGMIGVQFGALKGALGSLLNGVVAYDVYAPEPTMKFPGVDDLLTRYRVRAVKEGADPVGIYGPPYAYAEMQVLGQAITAAGSTDEKKLTAQLKSGTFDTVVGKIKYGPNGEWEKARLLYVQYQGIQGNDIEQFKQSGKQVILHPAELKSGNLQTPFSR
jgi:branched-chain amino acid transport system substrate-binding protein